MPAESEKPIEPLKPNEKNKKEWFYRMRWVAGTLEKWRDS